MTTINLSEHQKLPFPCITCLYFVLYAVGALHLSRVLYKSTLFMQNKANLLDSRMNVTSVITKDYENVCLRRASKTNPIQSQFKAKQSQSNPISNPISNPAPLRPEKYPLGLLFANDGI